MSRILKFQVPPGKPLLKGQDHYWRIIREIDAKGVPWGVNHVRDLTNGVHRSTIAEFIRRLIAGGLVIEAENGPEGVRYRLGENPPMATPKLRRDGSAGEQGRGQTCMWNMIRGPLGRGGFTFRDVALYASTKTVEIKPATAQSYVKHLAEAGYLHCLRKGKPGVPALYRLKSDMMTGILPPLVLRSQIVFDQNLNEAVGPVVAREVTA